MTLALGGVRVVDLTQVMAGPFCTMLLADLGADVIKVEPPDGDLTRSMGGRRLHMKGSDNAPFLALNRNKRSVVLDLKEPSDRERLLALLRNADVLVESFRPGVAERLGVGYERIQAINERLVYASISGFGQTGPWADRPGFDLIAQAMSGVMSVTGSDEAEPIVVKIPSGNLLEAEVQLLGRLLKLFVLGWGRSDEHDVGSNGARLPVRARRIEAPTQERVTNGLDWLVTALRLRAESLLQDLVRARRHTSPYHDP